MTPPTPTSAASGKKPTPQAGWKDINYLVISTALVTGYSPEKCHEVIEAVIETMIKAVATEPWLSIPELGTFHRPRVRGKPGKAVESLRSSTMYRPAVALMARLNPHIPPPAHWTRSKGAGYMARAYLRRPPLERTLTSTLAAIPPKPVDLTPRFPQRQEDVGAVEAWLRSRNAATPGAFLLKDLYNPEASTIYWGNQTVRAARAIVLNFASYIPTPLLRVGLTKQDLPLNAELLREEVLMYAQAYEARALARLAPYREYIEQQSARGPIVFRTRRWRHVVFYAREFYQWCERAGLRPLGSNPFAGLARYSQIDLSKGQKVVVREWFRRIFAYDRFSPRTSAVIHLLGNGLRISEVAHARLDHLAGPNLTVVGKGRRVRTVYLHPPNYAALNRWLASPERRLSSAPFIFPGGVSRDRPLDRYTIWLIARKAVRTVFHSPAEARIRAKIHPHMFRHYYISTWVREGGNIQVLMKQVGHSNPAMVARYTSVDQETIDTEMLRMDDVMGKDVPGRPALPALPSTAPALSPYPHAVHPSARRPRGER